MRCQPLKWNHSISTNRFLVTILLQKYSNENRRTISLFASIFGKELGLNKVFIKQILTERLCWTVVDIRVEVCGVWIHVVRFLTSLPLSYEHISPNSLHSATAHCRKLISVFIHDLRFEIVYKEIIFWVFEFINTDIFKETLMSFHFHSCLKWMKTLYDVCFTSSISLVSTDETWRTTAVLHYLFQSCTTSSLRESLFAKAPHQFR